jgi:hypothetical protein
MKEYLFRSAIFIAFSSFVFPVSSGAQKTASASVSARIVPQVTPGTITASPTYTVGTCDQFTIYLGYGPQSITLSAAAPSSGTPPYTYSWSSAASVSSPTSSSTVVSPTVSTTYYLTVTDANGMSKTSAGFFVKVKDVRCGNGKVNVCHQTGSSKNPYSVSCISINAVPAKISSGDCLGDCTN